MGRLSHLSFGGISDAISEICDCHRNQKSKGTRLSEGWKKKSKSFTISSSSGGTTKTYSDSYLLTYDIKTPVVTSIIKINRFFFCRFPRRLQWCCSSNRMKCKMSMHYMLRCYKQSCLSHQLVDGKPSPRHVKKYIHGLERGTEI